MPKKKITRRRTTAEDREMDNTFHQMTGNRSPKKKKPRSAGFIIAICASVLAVAVCIGAVFYYMVQKEMKRKIVGDVTIAGTNVQGMTQADAIKAVNANFTVKDITVTVLDRTVTIPAKYFGGLNTRKAVKAACNLGETATPLTLELGTYLKANKQEIQAILSTLIEGYEGDMTESTYEIVGQRPNQTLRVTLGMPNCGISLNELYRSVLEAVGRGEPAYEATLQLIKPAELDLDAIANEHFDVPIDAYYDPESKQIVGGEEGYCFNIEEAKQTLQNANYGSTVEFPVTTLQPAVNREAAEKALFSDVLGTFTARSSSQGNRDVNLSLACQSINGIILYPGDTFSYNEALGERTAARGYLPAASYSGNATVNTYGGGICQVSSSLYYCVLSAELKVNERTNHGFLPSYMPGGMDATVSWGSLDFKFENNQDYPILIEASANGGVTTVTIRGTETREYRVELISDVLSSTNYKTEYQELPPNNPNGYRDGDVIVTPYSGSYVKTYIYKYEKDSNKLISKDYIDDSKYRTRNEVICKIVYESTDPDSPDTDESLTPPAPEDPVDPPSEEAAQ